MIVRGRASSTSPSLSRQAKVDEATKNLSENESVSGSGI